MRHDAEVGDGRTRSLGRVLWSGIMRIVDAIDVDESTMEFEYPSDAADPSQPRVHLIGYRHSVGNALVAVEVPVGFDAARVMAYIRAVGSAWRGAGAEPSPQTVVEAMIRFYACRPAPAPITLRDGDVIDLHAELDRSPNGSDAWMADAGLERAGLREFLVGRRMA